MKFDVNELIGPKVKRESRDTHACGNCTVTSLSSLINKGK
jgi:hypothetical protein